MKRQENRGSYGPLGVITIAAVLLIALGVNLLFGLLPDSILRSDISTERLTHVSDEAKDYLAKNLSGEIEIYLVAESGMEDISLSEFLSRLSSLDERMTFSAVDPTVKRSFLENLTGESPDEIVNNTLIVRGEKYGSVKTVDPYTLYSYEVFLIDADLGEYVSYGEYPYREFTSVYASLSEYFSSGYAYYEQRFNGETAIISAIDYVLTDPAKLPKIYFTALHGEIPTSESLAEQLELSNLPSESLNIADTIPSDAGVIVMNSPSNDITETEASLLSSYLALGGKLFVITDYTKVASLENLAKVLETYGLSARSGELFETKSEYHLSGYQNSILPDFSPLAALYGVDNYYFLARSAHSLGVTETQGVTHTHLLKTTESAYYEFIENGETKKSEPSQFSIAISAIKNGGGEVVWFASPYMLTKEDSDLVGGGNYIHFTAILSSLCDKQSASFATRAMEEDTLTISAGQAGFWAVIIIAVIPAAVITAGTVRVMRRKRS